MSIAQVLLLTAGCVLLILISIIVLAFVSAYLNVKSAPREKLEFCVHHGMFKTEHALPLPGTEAKMCPRCYMEAMNAARKG